MGLFLLQGAGQAIYDVCGNQIIFRLWSGISESPVNAMHAGYGIGAMIAVQLLKPFLKFNPTEESGLDARMSDNSTDNTNMTTNNSINFNQTGSINSNDIKLQIPYSIAGLVGVLTIVIFIIAQFFEFSQVKNSRYLTDADEMPLKNRVSNNEEKKVHFSERIFGRYFKNRRDLVIISIQLAIIFSLFMAVMAYNMVLTTYMLTYATKGPAKFARDQFLTIQTFFWIIFIVGRFSAALIGFKLNTFYFFTGLVTFNAILVFIYNTKLNEIQLFYWFMILALGFTNGPLIPSCFAVAKYIFVKTNAFLVSIFCIGLGIGSLLATYATGAILDSFRPSSEWFGYTGANSSYIIPMILLVISVFSVIATVISLVIHKVFKKTFSGSDEN